MRPHYDYSVDSTFESRVEGYTASYDLTVSGVDIDKLGQLQDICVENGINQMNGMSYQYSKYDEAYEQALNNALEKAQKKAEGMVNTLGASISGVYSIDEGHQNDYVAYRNNVMMNTVGATLEKAYDTNVEPGEIEIEAEVSVTFEIENTAK